MRPAHTPAVSRSNRWANCARCRRFSFAHCDSGARSRRARIRVARAYAGPAAGPTASGLRVSSRADSSDSRSLRGVTPDLPAGRGECAECPFAVGRIERPCRLAPPRRRGTWIRLRAPTSVGAAASPGTWPCTAQPTQDPHPGRERGWSSGRGSESDRIPVSRSGRGDVIDIAFDFRSDAPPRRNPDARSPTLRRYHQLLWSKLVAEWCAIRPRRQRSAHVPAPPFRTRRVLPVDDAVVPTFSRASRLAHIIDQIPDMEREAFHLISVVRCRRRAAKVKRPGSTGWSE